MNISPIEASKVITDKYKRYLRTIFKIGDSDYSKQFDRELDEKNILAKGPYLDAVDAFKKGKTLRQLIDEGIIPKMLSKLNFPMDRPLYLHQEKSIRKCRAGNNIVVSTGTGSGKTESFLIPVLAELAREEEAGKLNPGIRVLLIYPMNALANDQMERLRELLLYYPEITFGSYTGQTNTKEVDAIREYKKLNKNRTPLPNELISRERMIETPPNIMITNYAMLEFLMVRPRESSFFSGQYAANWKFIILDEAHVYKGSTGIEVSMLLRRVKSCLPVQSLQYILTSATLGNDDQNQEVADFATRLCDCKFEHDNIIRASRRIPEREDKAETRYELESYHELAQSIQTDHTENIISALSHLTGKRFLESDDFHDVIYDYVVNDGNYWMIRELLCEKPHTVSYLAEKMNCTENQIVDFVTVASYGIKQGGQLFDAKYHMFIRAADSAFITLAPSKKLMLTRKKQIMDKGQNYTVFEMAVCRFCHAIYLLGVISEEGYFIQEEINKTDKKGVIYLGEYISDDSDIEDGNIEKIRLCPHCGKVVPWKYSAIDCCQHSVSEYVTGYFINKPAEEVNYCISCGNHMSNGSMLRQFFTGQEAVTSVLGTALFQALPSYKIIEQKIKIDTGDFDFDDEDSTNTILTKEDTAKQFIAFSDSRQAAAFYASYFSETYESLLYKRLIVKTLIEENTEDSLYHFAEVLQAYFEKYQVIDSRNQEKSYRNEAWKAILAEMVGLTNANALQNLGLLEFYVDCNDVAAATKWNLSKEEVAGIINVLFTSMMMDAAISYPVQLNMQDKEFFTYHGHEGSFLLSDSSKSKAVSSFIPVGAKGLNRRLDYLLRVIAKTAPDKTEEETRHFLESIWNGLLIPEKRKLMISEGPGYRINTAKLKIKANAKFYRCPVCKRITPYNVHGVCPTYHCAGELHEVSVDKELKDNHYYRLLLEMEIRKLRVVEHTAQLSREKAYEYQNLFKEKKIDVLSCSTTFELGVDVGSLETVFMRNMPPSPANYAQRAGRAGRSIKSVAYALTFCNKSNHDFSYFNAPESMIRGCINPPIFKVENDKIAIRHIFASTFAFFWKIHKEYFKDAQTFIEPNEDGITGVDLLEDYLKSRPDNLKKYLLDFLPAILVDRFDIRNYGWINRLVGPEGALTRAINEYKDEITKLQESLNAAVEGRGGNPGFISQRIHTFQNEEILTFLSRKNVMPKYGFPVDTVELSVYDQKWQKGGNKLHLDLQRDLSMAISEYAPDSQIVADGYLITSRYVRKVPNMAWKMYDYKKCDCTTLNIDQHIDYNLSEHLSVCHACGADLTDKRWGTFIVPEFGFEANKVEKATLTKPKRTYNTDIAYVGYNNNIEMKPYVSGNSKYEMLFSQNDEMAVMNQSNFYVCDVCGYAEVDKKSFVNMKTKEHYQPSGATCRNNNLKKYSLGYRFQTDVIQIHFCWPELRDYDQALSLLYGLIRGTCAYLNIEQSDISGCLQYFVNKDTGHSSYAIILYDDTPGGAGHVKRLYDVNTFENVLRETYRIVNSCTCGGEKRDTSCYNCLRTYGNQKYHMKLQRKYVLDFIDSLFDENLISIQEELEREVLEEIGISSKIET